MSKYIASFFEQKVNRIEPNRIESNRKFISSNRIESECISCRTESNRFKIFKDYVESNRVEYSSRRIESNPN